MNIDEKMEDIEQINKNISSLDYNCFKCNFRYVGNECNGKNYAPQGEDNTCWWGNVVKADLKKIEEGNESYITLSPMYEDFKLNGGKK